MAGGGEVTGGDMGRENLSGKGHVLSSPTAVMLDEIAAVPALPVAGDNPLAATRCPWHRASAKRTQARAG